MGIPRQEYWSGLPSPSPGDLPDLGTEPTSPALEGRCFATEPLGKPVYITLMYLTPSMSEPPEGRFPCTLTQNKYLLVTWKITYIVSVFLYQ